MTTLPWPLCFARWRKSSACATLLWLLLKPPDSGHVPAEAWPSTRHRGWRHGLHLLPTIKIDFLHISFCCAYVDYSFASSKMEQFENMHRTLQSEGPSMSLNASRGPEAADPGLGPNE